MAANTTSPAPTADQLLAVADDDYKPCACSFVHVEGEDLRCSRVTKNTFAPGHDAKLKSRLIRAGFANLTVRVRGEVSSVAEAAGEHGFGYQVAAGVVRLQRQAQDKANRKAARELQREANAATREAARAEAKAKREAAAETKRAAKAPKTVSAKVGRWVVQGTVAKNGDLSYTTKAGVAKVAKSGKYELVADGE